MKKTLLLILGIAFMLSCGDSFSDEYKKELLAARASGKTFALVTGTTIISFTEHDASGGTGEPGIFKARLSAPPESNVVLDLSKADQLCTTPGVEETLNFSPTTLVFTPENYAEEQEVEITVSDDMVVHEARGHRVILPALESADPLYNGVAAPTVYVTVFEDDTRPIAYPVTPYIGETNVPEYNEIVVTFNREMDESTIDKDSFVVTNEPGNSVDGFMWIGSDKKTVFISSKKYLLNGEKYKVSINDSIKDIYGNEIEKFLEWDFTTRKFTTQTIGSYGQTEVTNTLAIYENLACMVFENGIQIIDISDPSAPAANGFIELNSSIPEIAVSDGYVYILDLKQAYNSG